MTSDRGDQNPELSKPATDQKSAQSGKPAALTPQDQAAIREVAELVMDHPDELTTEVIHVQTSFSGPLPSPEDFARYNQTLPGAADRILAMAEKEQQIRANGQKGKLHNDSKRINTATFLGLMLIVVAGIAAWNGDIGIAVPLGLAGVISAVLRQLLAWLNSRTKPEQ